MWHSCFRKNLDGGAGRGEAKGASHHVCGRTSKPQKYQGYRVHLWRGRKHLEIQARTAADRGRGWEIAPGGSMRSLRTPCSRVDKGTRRTEATGIRSDIVRKTLRGPRIYGELHECLQVCQKEAQDPFLCPFPPCGDQARGTGSGGLASEEDLYP